LIVTLAVAMSPAVSTTVPLTIWPAPEEVLTLVQGGDTRSV
jgi:hypothetical protein